jgi:hypothetical protein
MGVYVMNKRVKRWVQRLEGRKLTFSTRKKRYHVMVKGVKGDKVLLKAYRPRKIGTQSFFGFDFAIPLILFLLLFSDGFFDGFGGFDGFI